jgi:gas vesicle protein
VKKILFGAAIGAVIMYLLDPVGGTERRRKLSGDWAGQKETVLEAARNTAATATTVSQTVGDIVGNKVAELRSEGESANGNVLAAKDPGSRAGR